MSSSDPVEPDSLSAVSPPFVDLSAVEQAERARLIETAMIADRHRLRMQFLKGQRPRPRDADTLNRRWDASRKLADRRRRAHPVLGDAPRLQFHDPLPICEWLAEIADAISRHRVVVIAGETGSGKSTQIPKICLQTGRGVFGTIGHTQPRRIAARSIASRVAEDLGTRVGEGVGFKVRFAEALSPQTHLKIMTDGILLAEIQSDRFLNAYDTLIIDEAHERSLNIDLILAHLHGLVRRRDDLRVIITSATIDAARFAAFFSAPDGRTDAEDSGLQPTADFEVPVIEVSGRTYPVETKYRPLEPDDAGEIDLSQSVAAAIDEALAEGPGDALVFLPTERDIRDVAEILRGRFGRRGVEILPLYGRLSERDQHRVFEPHKTSRVVLATNVAESSLTVPGIRYVIDSGLARISRFTPQSKVQRLPIEPVSRASADQRRGRCGRTEPGLCIRLYSEADYRDRDAYVVPEILRTNLASAVLQTLSSGLGDLTSLPLLDRPQPGAVRGGYATLFEIGAVRESPRGPALTETGRTLARWPVDPRIGRMLIAAHAEHCLAEVLIIAAALEVRDPRDRPVERQQAADEAHQQFRVEGSDFLTLIRIWDTFQGWTERLSNSQVRKACLQNFLSYSRMREWRDLHRQLSQLTHSAGLRSGPRQEDADALHRALLAGLLSNIALRGETGDYTGAGGQALTLWPGSAAVSLKPRWLLAAELVETSRRFIRMVGPIKPEWVEPLAGDLLKRSYSDPEWDRRCGSAMAYERVTLYGLTIIPRRRVRFAPIDPARAREIFITQALVQGDYASRAPFHVHNTALKEELKVWQAKLRTMQLFASEERQFEFFNQRIPQDVVDSPTFERWRRAAESIGERILFLSKADLLEEPERLPGADQFPDTLRVGPVQAAVEYRLDPAGADDGLTLIVPASAWPQLDVSRLGWLVPGMLEDKVDSLIKLLPKELRRLFVPIQETTREVVRRLKFGEGDLLQQIATALRDLSGEPIPEGAFELSRLPAHLRFNVRVVDAAGEAIVAGRDVAAIHQRLRGDAALAFAELAQAAPQWQKSGLRDWTFGELPEMIELRSQTGRVLAFPGLIDRQDEIRLQLFDDPSVAERETRGGLIRLFEWGARPRINQQIDWMPQIESRLAQGASVLLAASALDGTPSAALPAGPETGQIPATAMTPRQATLEFRRQISWRMAERACADIESIPRTEADFRRWQKRCEQRLGLAAADLSELLEPLLTKARETQKIASLTPPAVLEAAHRDIAVQWRELFGRDFFARVPWPSLRQYPRYLEGMRIRWEKINHGGLTKDREIAADVGLFWNRYREIMTRRPELQLVFQPVRWLIEEYRISRFAQQLRTAIPVSEKRLREAWEAAVAAVRQSGSAGYRL